MARNNRQSLFPVILTVFVDQLGMGIVIPIAAPLLMNPVYGMFPAATGLPLRSILLGCLMGSFSLAQFFGAPLLGALSDRHGRKKMFLLSITGTLIGYLLFALGISGKNIWLCFASRILDGFSGGNISIAMSVIADVSQPKDRAKNFGLIGMTFGLGFILGPLAGGKLADPGVVSWFSLSTPYWFAACLSLVNLALIAGVFPETLIHRHLAKVNLLTGLHHLREAFQDRKLRRVFLTMFLVVTGFNFFTQFFQVLLIRRFRFTPSGIADIFAFTGLCLALTQGLATRPLAKYYSPRTLVSWSALAGAVVFPLLLIPVSPLGIYLVLPFIALFNGINTPNLAAVISLQGGPTAQGRLLGIRQSVQAAAMAIPPLIAGFIAAIRVSLPIWAAAVFTLAGGLWFTLGGTDPLTRSPE
ncbi:MAG TPA: MFS transporter [Chitinophagaceae bacterium]|nr:MFS transporter [Chitinophagaceae bacterium]